MLGRKMLERAANIATVEMKGTPGTVSAASCQLCFSCRRKRRVMGAKPVHTGSGFRPAFRLAARLPADQAAKSEPVDKTTSALRPMVKNQRIDIGAPVEGGQWLTRHR